MAELANERCVFDELAELMEAGVLVDSSELVPPLAEPADFVSQASFATQLSFDHVEWQACTDCSWAWSLSCWREGCWVAEVEQTKRQRSA